MPSTAAKMAPSKIPEAGSELASSTTEASQGLASGTGEVLSQTLSQSATTTAQQVAPLAHDGFSWAGYFTAIGSLCILLALLWALVWALRKSKRFNFIPRPGAFPRDGLRIESQLPLGPRKGLVVVRFLEKRLLLGVTEHNITLLQEVEDSNDSTDFQSLLEHEQKNTR